MRKAILLFFVSLSLLVRAQNLVNNDSFELYDTCTPGQNIFVATGWKSYSGTPDYYNGCADSSSGVSVPYNMWGNKPAASGMAYAGFYSYESDGANAREYTGRQLSAPLTIGKTYFVSFKVNLVTNVSNINQWGADCANNRIGILFSRQSFTECPFTSGITIFPPNRATIYSQSIISDTTNWTTISGYFTADSAYNYFEIGNLFADSLIDTLIFTASNPYPWHIAYYLLDDVVVMDSLLTGITTSVTQNYFSVYPNPFNTTTTVKIKSKKQITSGEIIILDMMGNQVERTSVNNEETFINRRNIPEGIYFLKITIDNKTYTQKLIISN